MATIIRTFRYERFSKNRWKGIRILTTRRWPQYVKKRESRAYFDTWLPTLRPSEPLRKQIRNERISWATFVRKYKKEMTRPDARHAIRMLAALARKEPIIIGCGCEDEHFCHRSILKALIRKAVKST